MLTVLVDYDSGNLHSAEKAFQRMALEVGGGEVLVTSRPEDVARADRIVLPGDGAFPACRAALGSYGGLFEAIAEAVIRPAPAPSSASASACRCSPAEATNTA
jgi:imidazole glycerol-phosphate synthase subunit HisH